MHSILGFMRGRSEPTPEQELAAHKERKTVEMATLARDIHGMPPSGAVARKYKKALKKNRPPATTDSRGEPYSPITEVSPGANQKQRQKWQDSANKTRGANIRQSR